MNEFRIRYIVWVDGRTETSGRTGSISCTVGPAGAVASVLVLGRMMLISMPGYGTSVP
ncbi:MAG: hypothetical protein CM1200mP40_15660 [Gammaproteobacteria bacterium]|nr:MAG: hypothetical protein CM1200mP40_15660 [Gammaproteobacteria bacterium]